MVFPRPPKVGVFVTLQSTRSHMHEGFDQLGTKNVGDQIERGSPPCAFRPDHLGPYFS